MGNKKGSIRLRNNKARLLKFLRYTNKLTAYQKVASRIGYFGAAFLIAGQWTLEPKLFIIGFICVMIQTSSRKQWNLVALNLNGLIAWITHFLK
tara:strand:- start:401 stop:682 length:282 start_codon:yes stop_codon:yes gene_type:complete